MTVGVLWVLLVLLLRRVPAPTLLQFCIDEADTPSCFLSDLVEDLQDFLLLSPVGQTFSRNGQRSQSYAGNATVLDVSADPTDELGILFEHFPHLRLVGSLQGVDLGKQNQTRVIEKPRYYRRPLDEPYFGECGSRYRLSWIQIGHGMHRSRNVLVPAVRHLLQASPLEIGRASCRERVSQLV